MSGWDCCALSEQGGNPDGNEDFALMDPEAGVFIVADGIGGRPGGAVASRTAAGALAGALRRVPPRQRLEAGRLRAAAAAAQAALQAAAAAEPALAGMGSTLTAAVLAGGRGTVVHAGDSRLYRFTAGRLVQVTRDHTLAAELAARGDLSPEAARRSRMRQMLTRSVSAGSAVEPDVAGLELKPGDRLLLVTDGVCRVLDDERLAALMQSAAGGSAGTACRAVMDAALAAGPDDNVTVAVVVVPGPAPVRGKSAARAAAGGAANGG